MLLCIGASRAVGQSQRGIVDTAGFWSQALGTTKRYLIYLPPSYGRDTTRRFPVAYYLHGLWGNETDWTALGRLDHTLDSLVARGMPELIIVMPDGDDSWYTTWNFLGDYPGCLKESPAARPNEKPTDYCVPWPHYDDYIARDLVAHVDSTYRTFADRLRRGIAGLSMGGYGAVTLALAYPDVFGTAASHSGVLTPLLTAYDSASRHARYASKIAEVSPQFPSMLLAFGRDTMGWWARDPGRRAVFQTMRNARADLPALYIDVGTDDRFLNQSRAFRDVLLRIQQPHAYYERSGTHDWPFWRANAVHSLTFLAHQLMAQ